MLKRIISILLTVLMCMSMVTFTAMAEDSVGTETEPVTYLNADSTKIMIDLSQEVPEAVLEAAITLTAGDNAVTNFKVFKKPAANPTATTTMRASTDVSYVIIPQGGIAFDTVYNLNIDPSALGVAVNRYFVVEKLWEDNFQSYTTSNLPWTNAGSGNNCIVSLVEDGNDKYMKVEKGNAASIRPDGNSNFSTYGKNANAFFDAERLATKDYTVELKTRSDMETTNGVDYKVRPVRVSMQSARTTAQSSNADYICGGGYYAYKSDNSTNFRYMVLQAGLQGRGSTTGQGVGDLADNLYQIGYLSVNEIPYSKDEPEWNSLTLAARGQNVKVFAGDDVFINYNHDIEFTSGYGAVVITTNSNRTYYIDDIIATKMTDLELSDLEVTYWNADSSKIMLDLSAEVDATALKNAITLTENGAPVNFTVTAKTNPAAPTTTAYTGSKGFTGSYMTRDGNYSYVIKPEGGIKFKNKKAVYGLTIAEGLLSKDKTAKLPSVWSKNIEIEKIWEEKFDYEDTTALPWKDQQSATSAADVSLAMDGDNKYLAVKKSGSNKLVDATIIPDTNKATAFADTGVATNTYWAEGSEALGLEEYNVELKTKFDEPDAGPNRSLYISLQQKVTAATYEYGSSGISAGARYRHDASSNYSRLCAQVGLNKSYGKTDALESTGQLYDASIQVKGIGNGYVTVTNPTFNSTGFNTLSMAVKGDNIKNIKVYAGDDTFISYNYTLDVSDYGCVALVTPNEVNYYVDDIVVTKAREIATPDFGKALTVTELGDGKVDVSWSYDGKGNNMPCKVLLASYGASNSLKNVIPWDGTDLSGEGAVTFEGFDLKGGTALKLFVWKDLTTLYPYCATIEWPQAD